MISIDAADLVPGDCVLLGSGSAVPADCMINEGRIEVDQAALTGAFVSWKQGPVRTAVANMCWNRAQYTWLACCL